MKKRIILLLLCVAAITAAIVLLPFTRSIDTTFPVTEYRFNDPGYMVEHTATVQGYDTRNLLGHGRFEGTMSVSGFETAQAGWSAEISFPAKPFNTIYRVYDTSYIVSGDIFTVLADRNWTALAALIQEVEGPYYNNSRISRFDHPDGRFLVSGRANYDAALSAAAALADGTSLSPYFS